MRNYVVALLVLIILNMPLLSNAQTTVTVPIYLAAEVGHLPTGHWTINYTLAGAPQQVYHHGNGLMNITADANTLITVYMKDADKPDPDTEGFIFVFSDLSETWQFMSCNTSLCPQHTNTYKTVPTSTSTIINDYYNDQLSTNRILLVDITKNGIPDTLYLVNNTRLDLLYSITNAITSITIPSASYHLYAAHEQYAYFLDNSTSNKEIIALDLQSGIFTTVCNIATSNIEKAGYVMYNNTNYYHILVSTATNTIKKTIIDPDTCVYNEQLITGTGTPIISHEHVYGVIAEFDDKRYYLFADNNNYQITKTGNEHKGFERFVYHEVNETSVEYMDINNNINYTIRYHATNQAFDLSNIIFDTRLQAYTLTHKLALLQNLNSAFEYTPNKDKEFRIHPTVLFNNTVASNYTNTLSILFDNNKVLTYTNLNATNGAVTIFTNNLQLTSIHIVYDDNVIRSFKYPLISNVTEVYIRDPTLTTAKLARYWQGYDFSVPRRYMLENVETDINSTTILRNFYVASNIEHMNIVLVRSDVGITLQPNIIFPMTIKIIDIAPENYYLLIKNFDDIDGYDVYTGFMPLERDSSINIALYVDRCYEIEAYNSLTNIITNLGLICAEGNTLREIRLLATIELGDIPDVRMVADNAVTATALYNNGILRFIIDSQNPYIDSGIVYLKQNGLEEIGQFTSLPYESFIYKVVTEGDKLVIQYTFLNATSRSLEVPITILDAFESKYREYEGLNLNASSYLLYQNIYNDEYTNEDQFSISMLISPQASNMPLYHHDAITISMTNNIITANVSNSIVSSNPVGLNLQRITLVYDGSKAHLYINDTKYSASLNAEPFDTSISAAYIGLDPVTLVKANMTIYKFAMYNSQLSDEVVKALHAEILQDEDLYSNYATVIFSNDNTIIESATYILDNNGNKLLRFEGNKMLFATTTIPVEPTIQVFPDWLWKLPILGVPIGLFAILFMVGFFSQIDSPVIGSITISIALGIMWAFGLLYGLGIPKATIDLAVPLVIIMTSVLGYLAAKR